MISIKWVIKKDGGGGLDVDGMGFACASFFSLLLVLYVFFK